MSKLENGWYKKWNSLNVNVAKRLTPTREINQGREIVSAAVEEQWNRWYAIDPKKGNIYRRKW